MHHYCAIPIQSRAVVDRNLISTAGVTAGLDGALVVASLLRSDNVDEENSVADRVPLFHNGTPETASPDAMSAFFASYGIVTEFGGVEARRFARILDASAA